MQRNVLEAPYCVVGDYKLVPDVCNLILGFDLSSYYFYHMM